MTGYMGIEYKGARIQWAGKPVRRLLSNPVPVDVVWA